MRKNIIYLTGGIKLKFKGKYLGHKHPENDKPAENWHYYKDNKGKIYHIRKEHLICCIEDKNEK